MTHSNRHKINGVVGTITFHLLLLLLLVLFGYERVIPAESGGVEVMFGSIDAQNNTFTPREEAAPEVTPESSSAPQKMITQNNEESIDLGKQKEEKKRQQAEENERKKQERQAQAISNSMANSFKRSSQSAPTNQGTEAGKGSPTGNSTSGALTGVGKGYSLSGDLNGRGTIGSLPSPSYNTQESGWIEIEVVVDPSGNVISARYGKSSLSDARLRQSALEAARRSRFKPLSGVENMAGSITYHFNLR